MLNRIFKGLFTIIGLIVGYLMGNFLINKISIGQSGYLKDNTVLSIIFIIILTIFVGFFLFLISPWINRIIFSVMDYFEKNIKKSSPSEILFGTVGAILGLTIAVLFGSLFSRSSYIFSIVSVVLAAMMAVFGAKIAIGKKEELLVMFSNMKKGNYAKDKKGTIEFATIPKVLDTSVIIDGRILDLCQTGFIEGTLIIPTFVLQELRHIADSSDSLKRNRGRRGLDILNKIQKEVPVDVQIYEKDFPEIAEVDAKLLKLAQVLQGKVITNDYNLNKVAEFQGVPVLNINELANAIKPVVLPGEEMNIQIIKDGKESRQGIAYLDDGTMIVVEGGSKYIGQTIDVIVTSVLQTSAGRMIFGKQKDEV